MSETSPAAVVILAAGEGKRMKSRTPKVLHTLCGRTLLGHALAAADELDPAQLVVVVGHGREQVGAEVASATRRRGSCARTSSSAPGTLSAWSPRRSAPSPAPSW